MARKPTGEFVVKDNKILSNPSAFWFIDLENGTVSSSIEDCCNLPAQVE
jgi:hypothetical protein